MPDELIPLWVRRAVERRKLLALGVSLAEQESAPQRVLSELLAVDDVILRHQEAEQERASRA